MSDSDDMPISALKTNKAVTKRRLEDSSDDDVPIQQLAKKRATEKPAKSAADSDDELSLADLKKKAAAKAKPKVAAAKPKSTPVKGKPAPVKMASKAPPPAKRGDSKSPKSKTPSSKTRSTGAGKGGSKRKPASKPRSREQEQAGDKLVTRSGVLQETHKGQMVQKLLCRWWYAMEWPAKEDVISTPKNYVALEGYPGVYICVEGDKIGKLLDVRNKETCPCYANLSIRTSEELKQLLETALIKQKEALVVHWGEGLEEEGNIDRELKWLKHVDPAKAERAAARALAHAKLDF